MSKVPLEEVSADDVTVEPVSLVSDADHHTRTEWEAAAAAVLRKAGRMSDDDADAEVWQRLGRTTLDGLTIAPIGSGEEETEGRARPVGVRPDRAGDWDIRVRVDDPDPEAGNRQALAELENGATSLWLDLGHDPSADDLRALLDGVLTDLAPVVLTAPTDPVGAARALLDVLTGKGDLADGTNLGADPVGAFVAGHCDRPDQERLAGIVGEIGTLAAREGVLGLVVDATVVHDRGASAVQEVGYALALGVTYLRRLVAAGLSTEQALGLLEFRFAATDEQFVTIAKLRAARATWARVAEASGAAGVGQRQHVVTGRPMFTRYDPWVNMLRGTVACFAAGVGGAEAVTVLPFDAALGRSDAFGRRIARNVSSLLVDESHVAHVADPAGGAYAVEALTADLAGAAWEEFGRLETEGLLDSLAEGGGFAARLAEVVEQRAERIAHRSMPVTGVSEFPHLGESLPERPEDPTSTAVLAYSEPYERLRDQPLGPVLLATLGTVAAHTARAGFAANLFAAGGVGTVQPGPLEDPEAVAAAYAEAGAGPVVCVCGTDAAYAEWGAEAVAALRDAGARHVVLAGRETTAGEAGADDFCALGIDALDFLHRTRELLA